MPERLTASVGEAVPEDAHRVFLDVSLLEPPEPMREILSALSTLSVQEVLAVTHRREPFPLYQQLSALGFHYVSEKLKDGHFTIYIWHNCLDCQVTKPQESGIGKSQ